jgi:hypothetical protein
MGHCLWRRSGYSGTGNWVAAADYTTDEGLIPSQFTLLSVDKLHWSDDWVEWLAHATASIELHRERQRALSERDQVERERGKFSLPADAASPSDEAAKTESPALDAEWTRIIAKPTQKMTEYDCASCERTGVTAWPGI